MKQELSSDEQYYVDLGRQLESSRKWPQAIAMYRKALNKNASLWPLHVLIGNIFHWHADYQNAIGEYEKAIQIFPENYEAWYNLGNSQADAGDQEQAIRCYRESLRIKSDFHLAIKELGVLFQQQGRIEEAFAFYQEALKIEPNYAEGHASLGGLYARQGKIPEAIACYRRALSLNPDLHQVHSNLLFYINFDSSYTPGAIFDEYRSWNEKHAQKFLSQMKPFENDLDPQRRLRIGFVSPDLKEHVVATYLEPFLRHFNQNEFEVFCYANVLRSDETTQRLKNYSARWRDITALSDDEASELIREDQIDILVDLAGHMAENRLLVFARKPAPVQVTQWGYPNTTGLTTMDYRLTDAHMDPQSLTDEFHSEKLMRLSRCIFCYQPIEPSPEVSPSPFLKKNYITFGSFNNFAKVSDETLALWSRILEQELSARLLVLMQGGKDGSEMARQRFKTHKIPFERLDFAAICPRRAYLELHHEVDIALDPFPYNGGITTLESLWMGVPVITLEGAISCARHGVSLWNSLGITDFIAKDKEDYLRIALSLAHDPQKLRLLRHSLREQMKNSPLMDEINYTRALENAYRKMWQNYLK